MAGFRLKYGRWILEVGVSREPYITIGRWILRFGVGSYGCSRKVES